MRSATPTTSPRATSGGAWSRARSYRAARSCRRSHSKSSKPRVVTSTSRAPRRSSSALVAMVVPCTSSSTAFACPPSPHPMVSIARNMPTEGSCGVVTTLRTSIAPSCATATRSVNVPPTSTPTLKAPPPQRGTWNVERGTAATGTPYCSAFRLPRSAFSRQAPRFPALHYQCAREPQGRDHRQRPHPVPQPHVPGQHIARDQRARFGRSDLEAGRRVYVAQWVHRRRNARVSRACDAHARFDGAHHQVRQMLVGTGGAAIPRVVRDIDEEVRPPAAIATRQVGKDRFVTDQHAEPADRGRVERQPAPLTETPEPVQVEPARRDEGHPLDDGHEVMLVVDRVGRPVTRRIVKERSIVVVVHRGGIEAAGEEWRVCLTPALSEPSVPIRAAHEVVGYGGFGPKQQVEPAAVVQPSREGEEIGHDAVLVRVVPLLPEADVRLHEPHDARGAQRQRALAPRPVAPREGDAQEHHGGRLPPNRTSPFSLLPRQQRLDDHHVAPGQPQRYAARARQVRPLHQDRRVGERGAEAQPGKPDVPLV